MNAGFARLLACFFVPGWLLASLPGCASLPPPRDHPPSRAYAHPEQTRIGRAVRASAPDAKRSGVRLLVSGEDALGSLVALTRSAQRALDVQYYIVRNDTSTRTLMREIHAAALRGVRVRMLVDDLNTSGSDENLLCFTQHPNVELRLYNPFPAGRFSTISRVLASLTDVERINQRMHGKMFVADNAIAATGGRNLGDEYFVRSPSSNFVDLDVLVAGPAVRRLSENFDRFWNDPLAYPIGELVTQPPDCTGPVSAALPMHRTADGELVSAPDSTDVPHSTLAREIAASRLRLSWVDATVLADDPEKIGNRDATPGQATIADATPAQATIADEITRLIGSSNRELILITPYFVPGERGVSLLRELRQRGVRVRVLTNSLAATDAPVVHTGYARYRPRLLEIGVELHELRNQIGTPRSRLGSFGSSLASLHAKAVIVDRATVLVGSMNLDPRSEHLNTELGLVLPDAGIANQLVRLFEDVAENSSYRVELDAGRRLRWVASSPNGPIVRESEPDASVSLRALMWLLTPFAPEELL